jgi:hypothetical protein
MRESLILHGLERVNIIHHAHPAISSFRFKGGQLNAQ